MAGIRRGAEVHIHVALGVDDEGVHRMVAGERQPGNDDIRVPAWRDRTRRQRIAHDSVVRLRVERALIERDSRATGIAALGSRTEATDHVGMTVAFGILERHQESPGGRFVVSVVASAQVLT